MVVSGIFLTPQLWEIIQFDEHIFQNGLVQPPTKVLIKSDPNGVGWTERFREVFVLGCASGDVVCLTLLGLSSDGCDDDFFGWSFVL